MAWQASTYAVRLPPSSTTRTAAGTSRPRGSLTVVATVVPAEGPGEDVEEPGTSVGEREQLQLVVRRAASDQPCAIAVAA